MVALRETEELKTTSVSSATNALIAHIISSNTSWCTPAFEPTSVLSARSLSKR